MPIIENTIPKIFKKRLQQSINNAAFSRKVNGVWEETTFGEYKNFVEEICYALIDLNVERGDRIAILSSTRMEWAFADIGILCAGGVTVPIYQSNTPTEVEYVIENSGAQIVFVDDEAQLKKVLEVKPKLPGLKYIVVFSHTPDKGSTETCFTLEEFCKRGRTYIEKNKPSFDDQLEKAESKDMATIVYTSGTTGLPKGVILSHGNLTSELEDIAKVVPPITEEDRTLTFLPYAHIFARTELFCGLVYGWTAHLAENIPKLVDNLAEVRPTLMFCVPRIYEKIYNKILAQVETGSPLKKKIFDWSVAVGGEVSKRLIEKQPIPTGLQVKYAVAKKLVFGKLKEKFGGRLQFFVSAGAPLPKDIAEFFHAAGFLILEAYGLTETTGAVFANNPNDYEFGSVGAPMSDVEVKIAEDGEILVKSAKVFQGYYKNPEATNESIVDGWFYTGDIGHINEKGHLKITDRKKDIIVTSAGKNIAPQKIENLIKVDPYISQIMVYGDKRNYLTALITLSHDEVVQYAASKGIKVNGNLHKHPDITKLISTVITKKNKTLPSFETIKKFHILKDDFTIEAGELTPSLKVKRKFCTDKYKDVLAALYQ